MQQTEATQPTRKLEDLEIKDPQLIFEAVWQRLQATVGAEHLRFPKEIFWLNGAPGAGKGTHTQFIMQHRHFTESAIVVSNLLQSPEAQACKDAGILVGDKEVSYLVLRELIEPKYAQGAIVDGYPRTAVQVECVKLFYKKLEELHKQALEDKSHKQQPRRKPHFRVIVLFVDESESINRQLERGQKIIKHNANVEASGVGQAEEVRKTDLEAEAARKRYRIFKEVTYNSLRSFESSFPYHFIDAHGTIEAVQKRIIRELQYQSSLELSPATYDRLAPIPSAASLGKHARQQLVERLDDYEENHPDTFQKVVQLINRQFMPIIIKHAIPGMALVHTHDSVLEAPYALAMLIDIFSERGYAVMVDTYYEQMPESVDPSTHQIKMKAQKAYRIQIRFPTSPIRTL